MQKSCTSSLHSFKDVPGIWQKQETQLSLTNRVTHLCKCNGVADLLKTCPSSYVLPCRIWSHTHSVLTAIFPGASVLAGFPLNSSPFIPGLHILFGQTKTFHVILNKIPPGLFWVFSLSNSFNFPRYTTFDPVIIIFLFNPNQLNLLFLIIKLTGSHPMSWNQSV